MTTIAKIEKTQNVEVSLLDEDGATLKSFKTIGQYLPDDLECTDAPEQMNCLVELTDETKYNALKSYARE